MYPTRRASCIVFILLFSLLLFNIGNTAEAQTAPLRIPGPADAGRMEERFDQLQHTTPQVVAPSAPVTPAPTSSNIPAEAEKIHFVLKQMRIEGVTAYSQKQLRSLYQESIGKDIRLSEIYHIAEVITQRYRHDGYVLSHAVVPPQQITGGTVTIVVTEGSIGEVHTQGTYKETPVTKGIINDIQSMHPLNAGELERDVLLLNDLGGVAVHAVLEPMTQSNPPPGTVAVRLIFDNKQGAYSATIDNYGSRYLGPEEITLGATKSGLVNPYDQLSISGIGSLPLSELRYVSSQYNLPLFSNGLSLTLNGGYGTADPGYRLESEDVANHSYSTGPQLNWEAIRQRSENLTLGAGFDVKNIKSDIVGTELYDDNLRELHASAIYSRDDRWNGSNSIDTELTQGLNAFGASHAGSADISRADGHSEFTKVTMTVNRLQTVTDTLQLYAATSSQVTDKALLTSEEFGYGGQAFGRAYDTSEILGDDGLAGALELRYNGLPSKEGITSQPFLFYDIGKVWSIDTIGGSESGASSGLGWRFNTDYHISGTFTVAQPLTREIAANSPNSGKNPRGFFSISCQF